MLLCSMTSEERPLTMKPPTGSDQRNGYMTTLETIGAAQLLAVNGQREIAVAIRAWLTSVARRIMQR